MKDFSVKMENVLLRITLFMNHFMHKIFCKLCSFACHTHNLNFIILKILLTSSKFLYHENPTIRHTQKSTLILVLKIKLHKQTFKFLLNYNIIAKSCCLVRRPCTILSSHTTLKYLHAYCVYKYSFTCASNCKCSCRDNTCIQ